MTRDSEVEALESFHRNTHMNAVNPDGSISPEFMKARTESLESMKQKLDQIDASNPDDFALVIYCNADTRAMTEKGVAAGMQGITTTHMGGVLCHTALHMVQQVVKDSASPFEVLGITSMIMAWAEHMKQVSQETLEQMMEADAARSQTRGQQHENDQH